MELSSDSDYIRENVRKTFRGPAIGEVVEVTEHTDASDNSNHEANVLLRDGGKELRRVPIAVSRNGETVVPTPRDDSIGRPGDLVIVSFLGGYGQAPFVTDIIYSDADEYRAPLARAGHWRHRFGANDQLFVEAEPADHSAGDAEVIRLAKKPDGLSDPTTSVEIDDSGSSTQVNIETDGDIHLSAGGNIVIDEGGTAKPVATADHTHSVTLSDGSTSTTSKPDDTTSTEIE